MGNKIILSFDFDGTLYLSNKIKQNSFFDTVKDIDNGKLIIQKILEDKSLDRYQIFNKLIEVLPKKNELYSTTSLIKNYSDLCFNKIVFGCRSRAGKDELFNFLDSKNANLYLISATPYKELYKIIKALNLNNNFKKIYGNPQSKELSMKDIITSNKIKPSKLIHIGDGIDDYKATKTIGCKFIGIKGNGLENLKNLSLIDNLKEIIPMLK